MPSKAKLKLSRRDGARRRCTRNLEGRAYLPARCGRSERGRHRDDGHVGRSVIDCSNDDTVRGLIRREVVPALRRIHPAAEENILRSLDPTGGLSRPMEKALLELLASREGSKRVDLGDGRVAVREYESVWLERSPVPLEGEVRWGRWRLRGRRPGLQVRGWRAGDRLAGREKKLQDLFVDAKIPRSEREAWPLVVRGDDVVFVPGIAAAPGWEDAVEDEQQ